MQRPDPVVDEDLEKILSKGFSDMKKRLYSLLAKREKRFAKELRILSSGKKRADVGDNLRSNNVGKGVDKGVDRNKPKNHKKKDPSPEKYKQSAHSSSESESDSQ